ncbi:hypothetical protein SASPL_120593 [Salvia splendens]|uniref:Uncharacterized protein n=1 Tax=Salvia splendens TaxID=180675 RepID=A0A8X8XTE3_SALSN|nr:hypothetical protein SASPL_120593 [Salvia splendens]
MKESVLSINDPSLDKNVEEQTEKEPKEGPATKKVTKEKVNKEKEKVQEGVEKGETDDEKIRHETLKLKTSPQKIIEMFQSLNEEQMNEVIDMGFGELRNFGIAEVTGKMAYDLVKGFSDVDCTIQLENQRLAIYPEDVYLTLGMPIGGTLINRCRTHIDYLFKDISVVKEYNWCAYVLETLAVAVKHWRSTKNTTFTGPIAFLVAFYVDRVFHKKLLVSRVFPTVFGWTSEKLRQREKMELESADTIGRGSLVDRGDPDKLPRPSSILVFEEAETEEKDQWEVAIEGFATASEDAVRGLQNLLLSMTDVKNMIQNFEAMKIAGATACNMIGVILEVEVDEEETVASLKAALAEDKFNSPQLVEAVQSMFKVTAQLTQLAQEGPPFDIHPSFEQKNGDLARRLAEISSFTAIGRIQSWNTEKSVISVGSGAARLCASKSENQERNTIIGTSFNGGSIASHQTAVADYMEGSGDDAADEFYSEASGTKTKTNLDSKLRSKDETNDEELDVAAIVKSAVEAYIECDVVDEDFVTPFTNKSEPKLGKDLVIHANEQLYTVVMSNGRDDDADKLDEFASNIDIEVSEIPHFTWGDIDMVFFAFCVSKRYYTVCFCFQRRSVVIIDACKDGEDHDLRYTYDCIPEALV